MGVDVNTRSSHYPTLYEKFAHVFRFRPACLLHWAVFAWSPVGSRQFTAVCPLPVKYQMPCTSSLINPIRSNARKFTMPTDGESAGNTVVFVTPSGCLSFIQRKRYSVLEFMRFVSYRLGSGYFTLIQLVLRASPFSGAPIATHISSADAPLTSE